MKRLVIVAGAVAALVVGLFAIAAAGAQEATPSPTDMAGGATGLLDNFKSKLAENLGISEDELDAAIDETQIEMIDEAVANGLMDEERAADLKEKIESGEDVPLFFGGRPHGPHFPRIVVHIIGNAAEVLDMELDDLTAELRDGKSLAQVAEEQGMSVEDFTAALLDEVKADLDQKVADGDLTQEEADNMFARLSENIDEIVNRVPGEGPHGPLGEGPLGGFREGRFPGPAAPFSEDQEETSLTIDA